MSGLVLKSTVDLQFIIVDDGKFCFTTLNIGLGFAVCLNQNQDCQSITFYNVKKNKQKLIKFMKSQINHKNKRLFLFLFVNIWELNQMAN